MVPIRRTGRGQFLKSWGMVTTPLRKPCYSKKKKKKKKTALVVAIANL